MISQWEKYEDPEVKTMFDEVLSGMSGVWTHKQSQGQVFSVQNSWKATEKLLAAQGHGLTAGQTKSARLIRLTWQTQLTKSIRPTIWSLKQKPRSTKSMSHRE